MIHHIFWQLAVNNRRGRIIGHTIVLFVVRTILLYDVRIDGHFGDYDVSVANKAIELLTFSLIRVWNDFEADSVQVINVFLFKIVQIEIEVTPNRKVVTFSGRFF